MSVHKPLRSWVVYFLVLHTFTGPGCTGGDSGGPGLEADIAQDVAAADAPSDSSPRTLPDTKPDIAIDTLSETPADVPPETSPDTCTPDCDGNECGPDGCGGSCGSCPEAAPICTEEGKCQIDCLTDCDGKECGPDGCGGICGSCPESAPICAEESKCQIECLTDCDGKECGPDGCGGSCGSCPEAAPVCTEAGKCQVECLTDCDGKECGSDGCGGNCGDCDDGDLCTTETCDDGACTYLPVLCDNGDPCTIGIACEEGVCTTGIPLDDGTPCDMADICIGACLWGMCIDQAFEICDGQDNDCDGIVDEDLIDAGPEGANCDGNGKGVCQVGLAASCSQGMWTCSYEGVVDYEASELSCDGLDNDCDGETDESLNWEVSPGLNSCLSMGVCDPEEVVAACTKSSYGWLCNYQGISSYTSYEGPGECDGLDNDCDGDVDEQACGPCAPCTSDGNCYNNLCNSDPFGAETFCATGATSCVMSDLATGQCKAVGNAQTACVTSTTRGICSYGTWDIASVSDCAGDTPICYDGLCKFCSPQALSCDGAAVLQCDSEGNGLYQVDVCPPGQICDGAGSCFTNTEFQIDLLPAYESLFDQKPRVAGLKGGGFVAVWSSDHPLADGSGTAVLGRIYGPDLGPNGESFAINEILENNQGDPAVDASMVGLGRFVVAWSTMDTTSDPDKGIAVRVYETDGTPVTGEIPVNQIVESDQSNPAVTMHEDGRFLVSWDSMVEDDILPSQYDVKARYFFADGAPDGDEFTLNTFEDYDQRTPDVSFLPDGGIAASWSSTGISEDGSGYAVIALTLDEEGVVLDQGEILINEYTFGGQKNQVVVALEEGLTKGWFAVVWESQTQASGDSSGIFMEVLNDIGVQVGTDTDIQVHQNDAGAQGRPRAARLAGDRLVVVWESDDIDPDDSGIARRIFNTTGGPETYEGLVNQAITGSQVDPDVSAIDSTTFVVVWTNSFTGHVMGRILND